MTGKAVETAASVGRGPRNYADNVETLLGMIDCAILEGAQMRLPLFVMLLRLARIALIENASSELDMDLAALLHPPGKSSAVS
ncbi:MAG: hypothetical protein AB7T86_03335 [Xanthobacteraceae bacterium]|jgi:hypothetical protein|uniref:hypothetical protein n=1 Tax=Pseudolabrys sp. TaxID=1960880 RepID=UPI003D0A4426